MNKTELTPDEYKEEQKRIADYLEAKNKKQTNKILFLDIDGVIAPFKSRGLQPGCLEILKGIVKETGCRIVLSSTWR